MFKSQLDNLLFEIICGLYSYFLGIVIHRKINSVVFLIRSEFTTILIDFQRKFTLRPKYNLGRRGMWCYKWIKKE